MNDWLIVHVWVDLCVQEARSGSSRSPVWMMCMTFILNSTPQDRMMKSAASSSPASGLDLQETDVRGNVWWCQTSVMRSSCKYRGVRVTTGCVEKNVRVKEGSSGEIRNHLKKEERRALWVELQPLCLLSALFPPHVFTQAVLLCKTSQQLMNGPRTSRRVNPITFIRVY